MAGNIGVLTAGGDTPGLNSAIRAIGKSARQFGFHVIGFRDGFRGMMENRFIRLEGELLSGLLTRGGTILGTSRDKPHKMPIGGQELDMTEAMVETYRKNHLEALICLGGGGTQKNAYHLQQAGLNVITLPKTIDNDVACTDVTFGFDTALSIATEAIDRLHSTAHSHHRIIVVEIMGHNAGWLALGAGLAGGADVILIPEIPYEVEKIAEAIVQRSYRGSGFSIVAVSEGAVSQKIAQELAQAREQKAKAADKKEKKAAKARIAEIEASQLDSTARLTRELEAITGLESRVTILGHVQRGGTPSAPDRILTTKLGTAAVQAIDEGLSGVMIAVQGEQTVPVPLDQVAGNRRTVPLDHPSIISARLIGVSMGDSS